MQNKNESLSKGEKAAFLAGTVMIAAVIISTFALPAVKKSSLEKENAPDSSSSPKKNSSPKISPQELQKQMLSSPVPLVIDLRSAEEYYTEHILDSVRISPEELLTSDKVRGANHLVLVANNGNDELLTQAYAQLTKDDSPKSTVELAGGLMAWKNNQLPLITYGDPTSFSDQAKVHYLTAEELRSTLTENPSSLFLLDIRPSESFAAGHLEGAHNIPLEELELRRGEIPSDKAVVVLAENELFEFQAAVQLYDMRMLSAYVLKGALPGMGNGR